MKKMGLVLAAILISVGLGYAELAMPQDAQEAKAETEAWFAKSDSVKAVVETVLKAAVDGGAESHAVAKDNVIDARHWIAEAEKARESAGKLYDAGDFDKAKGQANMVWQYYVKAGTAAVLAARMVGVG